MYFERRGLNEECGIFGIWGHKDAARLTYYGLHALQHRGQDGAGIIVKDEQKLFGIKGHGLLVEVFDDKALDDLTGDASLGHVLYATGGKPESSEIQPLLYHFESHSMAVAHNGMLVNAPTLRKNLEKRGSIFQSKSNSELLTHVIKKSNKLNFITSVKWALHQAKGGFATAILTGNELIAARDPRGIRPLAIGRLGHSYVVASETCAFDLIGADFVRDVSPGEIVIINGRGMRTENFASDLSLAVCGMEYIYFARPDSNIQGVNIHTSRKNAGRVLAKESRAEADVVIASPDSGISAAIGFAEESGLPYEIGLIKHRYVGRTFIAPSQDLREQGVKMKLSAVRSIVHGKSVALVDDSVVRGTTMRRIVNLLRDAGAREVHVRVASPMFRHACFYGIDLPSPKELIAHNNTIEGITRRIGADSLAYISEDGIAKAIGIPVDGKNKGLCLACFTGECPTDLYDFA